MLNYLDSLGAWRSVGFVALQAIQVIIAPIPGEITGILGGYLYGLFKGVLFSTVGLTIGSYVAFLLARIFGKPLADRIVPGKVMERFDYLVENKGSFLVFLLFFIPGIPKDYFCYIFGLSQISTMEYLVLSTVGRLFGTILLTLEGSSLKFEHYFVFGILAAIGVVSGVLALIFRNRLEIAFKRISYIGVPGKKPMSANGLNPE
jgi:uncharacterized membrane protein YdjX (TVP38/TMEM64 family)